MRRVSLLQLLVVIAVVALGLAAIRSGSIFAVRSSFTLTISVLLTAILGALLRARPFGAWLGFALFGVVWSLPAFVMVWFDLTEGLYVHEVAEQVQLQLPTPAGFPSDYDPTRLPVYDPVEVNSTPEFMAHAGALRARRTRVENSAMVITLMICLVMGLLGSIVGRVLEARCTARP